MLLPSSPNIYFVTEFCSTHSGEWGVKPLNSLQMLRTLALAVIPYRCHILLFYTTGLEMCIANYSVYKYIPIPIILVLYFLLMNLNLI